MGLSGTPKNNLATDYNNYVTAHTNLINSIYTAISDGATTPAEKADVDSKFSSYRLAVGVLTTRFQEAIKAIETATVNAIQVGGRNFLKNSKNFEALTSWGKNANVVVTNSADYITLDFPSSTAHTGIFQSLDLGGYKGDITISFDALSINNGWNADLNIGIEGKAVKTGFGINDVATWKRFSFTLNLATETNVCAFIFYKGGNNVSLGLNLKNIKLEKGNKATDWSPSVEDVNEGINNAQTTANNAITLLTDIGSDNKLTASEKQTTLNEWNRIKSEYLQNYNQASALLLSVTSYQSAYNALNTYITPLLVDLSSTSTIDGNTFRSTFKNYYDQNVLIVTAIGNKQIDNVTVGGRNLFRDSIFTKGFNLIERNGEYRNTDYDNKPNPFGRKGFGLFGSGDFYGYFNQQIPILPNTDYTLSFYLKTAGSDGNSSYIQYNDGSHQALEFNQNYSPDVQEIKTTFRTKNNVSWIKLRFGFNSNFLTWSVFSSIKLEKGNKATDWTPAPEDVQDDINTAQSTANNAIVLLTDLGSDNKLTASEKQTTQNEWNRIKSEYSNNLSVANGLLLSVTSYESAYNTLNNYLNPLLADLTSTTEINGSIFRATFKNYYDANVAIVTAIGNKQIENVQVGGRNFLKNSGNFRESGWNGGFSDNGGGYTVDSNKMYLGKLTLKTTLGSGLVHDWVKLENNKEYTYSALIYGDAEIVGTGNVPLHYWAGYNNQNEGKIQVIKWDQVVQANNWKLIYLTFKLTENADSFRPFLFTGSSANTVVWLAYLKLERGNKATDWVPAIEDTSADITVANQNSANALAQAQNAMNTAAAAEAVTDFLTKTTINGNTIATGTLQVGDVNGANAMISGVTDKPNGESIRFAAGKPYAQKYNSPFQVLDNGMVRFVNPLTGQKTFELGFNQNTGKVVFDIYNDNGIRVASIGSQGIMFTGYVPESYTKYNFRKLTTNTFTTESVNSELSQLDRLQKYLTSTEGLLKHYNLGLLTNYVAYEYYEGINFESAGNAQYARFYPTKNKFDSPIPDGIYARQNIISVTVDGDESGVIVHYNTTVYLFENGKIKSSINANAQQRIDRIPARSENFPPEDFQ